MVCGQGGTGGTCTELAVNAEEFAQGNYVGSHALLPQCLAINRSFRIIPLKEVRYGYRAPRILLRILLWCAA